MGKSHHLFRCRHDGTLHDPLWQYHRHDRRRRGGSDGIVHAHHPGHRLSVQICDTDHAWHDGQALYPAADLQIYGHRVFPVVIASERLQLPLALHVHTLLHHPDYGWCWGVGHTAGTRRLPAVPHAHRSICSSAHSSTARWCGFLPALCSTPSRSSPCCWISERKALAE